LVDSGQLFGQPPIAHQLLGDPCGEHGEHDAGNGHDPHQILEQTAPQLTGWLGHQQEERTPEWHRDRRSPPGDG
jgi:hypothetical protein